MELSQSLLHGAREWWWYQGTVRICVDFKVLNESVLREVYPIPKVDNTPAQLAELPSSVRLMPTTDFGRYH